MIGGLWGAMASLRNKIDKVHEVTKRAEYSLAGGHAETAYVLLALDGKELSEVSEKQVQVKEFICTPSNTLPYHTFLPFPSFLSLPSSAVDAHPSSPLGK